MSKPALHISDIEKAHKLVLQIRDLRRIEMALEQRKTTKVTLTAALPPKKGDAPIAAHPERFGFLMFAFGHEADSGKTVAVTLDREVALKAVHEQIVALEREFVALGFAV